MDYFKENTLQAMSRTAANLISAQVVLQPASVLGLATGSTPIGIYDLLAARCDAGDLDFSRVTTINLDEYAGMEPQNPQSYRYFMEKNLFGRVNIKPENTHLPQGTAPNQEAECARYEALIAEKGGIDLQLLGIGHNGHIGFNEPADAFSSATHCVILTENTRNANARFFASMAEVPTHAFTMGMRAIMQAKRVLLVAGGSAKADILDKALNGPITPQVPASLLQLHPNLTVVACLNDA